MSNRRIAIVLAAAALFLSLPSTAHEVDRKHTHTKSGRVVWGEPKPAAAQPKPASASTEAAKEKPATTAVEVTRDR